MTLLADPSLGALRDVFQGLVFAIFTGCALLLMIVVLLQEGKGGGLGSAFGGAAADAFGVKAGTVNRFTTWLATGFLGLALLYAGMTSDAGKKSMVPAIPEPATVESTDPGETTPPPADPASPGDAEPETPDDTGN